MVLVPCSVGDALDRVTILTIKSERIEDQGKLRHVARELAALATTLAGVPESEEIMGVCTRLKAINEQLWDVEDQLRVKETQGDFGEAFVQLARSVYVLNDTRAELKSQLNDLTGSELVEVKSYASHGRADYTDTL